MDNSAQRGLLPDDDERPYSVAIRIKRGELDALIFKDIQAIHLSTKPALTQKKIKTTAKTNKTIKNYQTRIATLTENIHELIKAAFQLGDPRVNELVSLVKLAEKINNSADRATKKMKSHIAKSNSSLSNILRHLHSRDLLEIDQNEKLHTVAHNLVETFFIPKFEAYGMPPLSDTEKNSLAKKIEAKLKGRRFLPGRRP